MSDDITFVDGLIFKKPAENAPDFVIGKLSVKLKEFFEFAKLHQSEGWLNAEIKVSRAGKPYIALDTWKPAKQEEQQVPEQQGFDPDTGTGSDEIPF